MTKCLTDAELQAVADNEADHAARMHVAECQPCRARVQEIRHTLETFGVLTGRLPGATKNLELRVQQTLHQRSVERRLFRERGATTLRPLPDVSPLPWGPRIWTSGLAAVAMIVLAVFVIWPGVSRESRLSAAEILGRSLQTFSATSGVETFEYDVQFDGLAARALVPDRTGGGGRLHVTQVIDHDHPGRYRVMSVDADHTLRSTMAQDPARGVRAGRFRLDDAMYFFEFTAPPDRKESFISLPELQRTNLRALVSIMQTTSDQKLTTVSDDTGTYYAIQVPPMSSDRADAGTGAAEQTLWDLSEAHALIHTGDFHLKELSARGTFLGQPFALAFTLVKHETEPVEQMAPDTFTIAPEPGDIRLAGPATSDAPGDVVLAALRALGKSQR